MLKIIQKKQWQVIKKPLKRIKSKVEITKLIDKEGNCFTSPKVISKKFNQYFANCAANLILKAKNCDANEATYSESSYGHEQFIVYIKITTQQLYKQ